MCPEVNSALRTAGAALLALLLVLAGVEIGVNFWPRIVTVERRIVEPVRKAAASRPGLDAIPDLVQQSCPAIALVRGKAGTDTRLIARGHDRTKASKRLRSNVSPAPPNTIGFFITDDGFLLTSKRALPVGDVEVVFSDGRVLPAERMGADQLSGLALLKVDVTGLANLRFAEDGFPRVGQTVLALATPNATGCSVQAVLVGADFLAGDEGLQANVLVRPALDPSYAGVPILDLDGNVIGVSVLNAKVGSNPQSTVILPGSTAKRVADELVRNGKVPVNGFGFEAEDVGPTLAERAAGGSDRGAIVSLISPNSPADQAGLKAGDVVFSVASEPVSSASEVARALDTEASKVELEILRHSQRVSVSLQRK